MNVPNSGSKIKIESYKHNGTLHRIWKETTLLKGTTQMAIGGNDKTEVYESDGRTWTTREPAICYFHAEHWFNVIGMLRQDGIYYYCNLSSPFTWDKGILKYIDYDLDVKVYPDMTYTILDEDEYVLHKEQMQYPAAIDEILNRNMKTLITWIQQRKGPFAPGFVDDWYEYFLTFRS
ncbi:nucleoside tri-diphosphate phosphatase [Bacillus solimangrovi]|uniref:Nucleoside triphosphate/diphosphate phosphatase n=1 Tax=Bacillus solimangrovi TaxID=1305675 RepID=A0A1E5LBE6_9BACI|nr:DUF402 domain-containing protein [Bacillus solimangrovi]OEH91396.1 hypothetical protein BFG57_05895 [Bacillus solimangrovi]